MVIPKKEYPSVLKIISLNGHCNNNCAVCMCNKRSSVARESNCIIREAEKYRPYFNGFIITDGEPTLLTDLPGTLSGILDFEPEALQIHTNGRMFAYKKYLKKMEAVKGVDYVIRIFSNIPEIHDSITRERGSCLQTLRGLCALAGEASRGIGVFAEIPLLNENINHTVELVKILHDAGVAGILLTGGTPFAVHSPSLEDVDRVLKESRKKSGNTPIRCWYATDSGYVELFQTESSFSFSGLDFPVSDTNNPLVFRSCHNTSIKFLLAYAPYNTDKLSPAFIAAPLSLGSINSFLSLLDYKSDLLDLEAKCLEMDIDLSRELLGCWFVKENKGRIEYGDVYGIVEKMFEGYDFNEYKAVGLSLIEHFQANFGINIVRYIREAAPDASIAVGCLRNEEFEDYDKHTNLLCEAAMFGEYYMAGLMNRLEHKDRAYPAIFGNRTSALYGEINPLNVPCDLKKLPPTDFSGLDANHYQLRISNPLTLFLKEEGIVFDPGAGVGLAMFEISKGCNRKCVFCSYNQYFLLKDPVACARNMAKIFEQTGLKGFHLIDTSINNDCHALELFCDELIRIGKPVLWCCSARPSFKDRNLPEKMRESGCVMLTLGVESGSESILKKMRRGVSASQVSSSLGLIANAGIVTRVNFMSGFIGENESDVDKTLSFIRSNRENIDIVSSHSSFVWYDNMNDTPEVLGVTLRNGKINTPSGMAYTYDEIGARTWEEIRTFKENSYLLIEAALEDYRNINLSLSELDIFNIYHMGLGRTGCIKFFDYLRKTISGLSSAANVESDLSYRYRIKAFFGD